MARVKLYLDCRKAKNEDGQVVIKLTHHNGVAFVGTGVRLRREQWDDVRQECINHPNAKGTNQLLSVKINAMQNIINALDINGELHGLSVADIKRKYLESIGVVAAEKRTDNFVTYYNKFSSMRPKEGTRSLYGLALKQMEAYDSKIATRRFEDLTKNWMVGFQSFLLGRVRTNTASIYLRCVRAVFNGAIDDELTSNYPFRKLKIKSAATKDRSLSAADLRKFFAFPCAQWQGEYVDMFRLIFLLCGINIGDLANLDAIHNGRIEYDRLKTGKHYSIKVEPEAQAIIDKYRGKRHLLSILDRYGKHQDYNKHLNNALKLVGMRCEWGTEYSGTPLFPEISTYYARYSWASIAAELDIPKDTIAAALGHRQDVTDIYIRTDMRRKVDEANRKVIDFVFGDLEK